MELANSFLAPYNTQLHRLNFRPLSLSQWHISSAELSVDDSDITLSDVNILLDENTKLWAFKVSDLQGIAAAKIDVNLAPSALIASSQNSAETGPTIALNVGDFPDIALKQTNITLKGAEALGPSVELNNLSLNKLGQLTSQLNVNHKPLLSLSATLTPKLWKATTHIDLTLLQSFSRQLAATEKALHSKQTQRENKIVSDAENPSLFSPLYRFTQAIDDEHISVEAKLDSQLTLNLETAQLNSKNHLIETRITFNDFAKQTLQPTSLISASDSDFDQRQGSSHSFKQVQQKQQKQQQANGRLDFEINGHITSPKLTVMPFELVLALENNLASSDTIGRGQNSDEQLLRLLKSLNDKPFEQALFNLYQQLSPRVEESAKVTEKRPSLLVKLDKGLSYQFAQQILALPKLALVIQDSKLDAKVLVSDINYQTLESEEVSVTPIAFQLNANWIIEASHNQALTLNRLWPKLAELPYLIEFGSAALALNGTLSASQTERQTSFSISVASGAKQVANGIKVISTKSNPETNAKSPSKQFASTSSQAAFVPASQLNTLIDKTQLTLTSAAKYRYQQNHPLKSSGLHKEAESQTSLTIPSLNYEISALAGHLALNNALEEDYKLKLERMSLALQQAMSLQFTSGENIQTANSESTNAETADTKSTDTENEIAQSAKGALSTDSSLAAKLLSHTLNNQIDISVTQLSLDKSGYNRAAHSNTSQDNVRAGKYKRRHIKQKLAYFDTIDLSQKLALNHQRIHSDESWQVNDLYLTSQHLFTPNPRDLSRFDLIGDWQFKSEFAPILAFLSQTDSLPDSLDIQGNTELAMHYQLKKSQQLAFDLTLDPQVSDIQGSLNNLPFDGGNMDTQCQFSWQQDSSDKRESAFNCDNIKLSLQAFNPGVLITDIDAEAAVSFTTESQATGSQLTAQEGNETALDNADDSAAGKENLALAKQLLGVKQASVGLTAKGNLLGGQLLIPQFQLNLKKPSSAYFVLQHIDLKQLLAIQPQVGIYADGIFDGVLPVKIEKGKASVSGGKLAARAPGGLIAIGNNPAVEQMRQSQPYLEFAFSALEHLSYSELSSSFDMDAQGDAKLKVNVKGRSRGIERPIHFNYSQEENMLQLLRSLQIGDDLQNQIERAVK
ncbi:YdbH domain-containing protein [Shewanella schlegeliana]|uniref:YdbH domain-containing protein n=1 Tax=Shewanella schlegeliana TaxID=190308 RepID=A0ABS1T2R7_9GAMM|nr:YdbH domain-containing protein [Shewanella schlegeliana]